jgi:crossover junction endodeoxyribonuclease RuvC
MRILGIDPGLRLTGYGLVEVVRGRIEPQLIEGGVLRLDPAGPMEARLGRLHDEIISLIAELKPARLTVEKLYAHYKHPRTAILMAHARGVILLAAHEHHLPVSHLPATEVKKAITGYGHATKEQIQLAVQTQCRLAEPPSPPDVADAIAIALTEGRRMALEGMKQE